MKKGVLGVSMVVLLAGTLGLGSTGFAKEVSYGNGVYCNKHTCRVDWNEAWKSVGHIAVNGWIEHGPWAHGK